MQEALLAIIAAELGLAVLLAVVFFGLEVYALHLARKMPKLQLITRAELAAHGIDLPEEPPIKDQGQYL